MDIILPGIPNLRDEEGLPLNPPQLPPPRQPQTTPPQPYKYQQYKDSKASPALQGRPKQGGVDIHATRNGSRLPGEEEEGEEGSLTPGAAGPTLPPRNYNSEYRNNFHHQQQPPRPHPNHTHHHPQVYPQGHSDHGSSSNSHVNLSQDMDGSLLDLADELGGAGGGVEGRTSSTSLHSGSAGGRRSHTDLVTGQGYPREMQNGNYKVSIVINTYTISIVYYSVLYWNLP